MVALPVLKSTMELRHTDMIPSYAAVRLRDKGGRKSGRKEGKGSSERGRYGQVSCCA